MAAGAMGEHGRPGIEGLMGRPGLDGLPGDKGQAGDIGRPGRDGNSGRDGAPGNDGFPVRANTLHTLPTLTLVSPSAVCLLSGTTCLRISRVHHYHILPRSAVC